MSFIDSIKDKVKQNIKTIILTESEDVRVLQAAEKVTKEGFAKIILIRKCRRSQNTCTRKQY